MKTTTTTTILTALLVLISTGHSVATAGTLRTVALTGDAAPGTGSGVSFPSFFGVPVLNDAGQTAFTGFLTGTGVIFSNNFGIWSEGGGAGLALVARAGNVAPGTGGDSFTTPFSSQSTFSIPVLNDAGQTAFVGSITDTRAGGLSNNRGIWSEGGGAGLALVTRAGNVAPGANGAIFFNRGSDEFSSHPVLNSAGKTAFRGRLSGTEVDNSNRFGIWSEGGGTGLDLVARDGDAAPGTSSGVNFSGLGSNFFINPVLNDAGQIAFRGDLTGIGVNGSNSAGIWSEGGGTGLALVAREGDEAPGHRRCQL